MTDNKLTKHYIFITIATLIVFLIVTGGFYKEISVLYRRGYNIDQEKSQEITSIYNSIVNHYISSKQLPESLDKIENYTDQYNYTIGFNSSRQAYIKNNYEYKILDERTYQLCTEFKTSANNTSNKLESELSNRVLTPKRPELATYQEPTIPNTNVANIENTIFGKDVNVNNIIIMESTKKGYICMTFNIDTEVDNQKEIAVNTILNQIDYFLADQVNNEVPDNLDLIARESQFNGQIGFNNFSAQEFEYTKLTNNQVQICTDYYTNTSSFENATERDQLFIPTEAELVRLQTELSDRNTKVQAHVVGIDCDVFEFDLNL